MNSSSVNYKNNVEFRSDLFTLLSEACELEHGLACSYLYSSFTIKQNVDEGLTAEQLHIVRSWAAKIFFISSQEMLHLAQVWNLLNAIGGTPYYFRPNFPQKSKYYPFNVPLSLEPFSLEALQRFILYELPSDIDEKEYAKKTFGYFSEDDYSYKTVGDLYGLIKEGINTIPEKKLFIGDPSYQMGPDEIDFKEIIKVVDRQSAIQAIDLITHQGEGTESDRDDCHHGIFVGIEKEYKEMLKIDRAFQPSRNTISNPITYLKGNYATEGGELIINENTRIVSDIFDDIYNVMVRALQYSFNTGNTKESIRICKFAINLMIRVIKPLGEFLTTQPAFNDIFLKNAGPTFSLTRHIPLPTDHMLTKVVLEERVYEIAERMKRCTPDKDTSGTFGILTGNYLDTILSLMT